MTLEEAPTRINGRTDFFRRQLAASTPRCIATARNKATHFIGIPVIVFSAAAGAAPWRFDVAGHDIVRAARRAAIVAVLGWMVLDFGIGLAMAAIMLVMWYAAEALAGALGRLRRVDRLRRPVHLRLGAAVPRPPLRGQAAGPARQHLPGLHRADVPGRRESWWSSAIAAILPIPWAKVTSRPGEQGLICRRSSVRVIRIGDERNRRLTHADQAQARLGIAAKAQATPESAISTAATW